MIDTNGSDGVIVKRDHWSRYITEGASFSMSMIMSHLQRKAGSCPRPGCPGSGLAEPCERTKVLTWYALRLSARYTLALT